MCLLLLRLQLTLEFLPTQQLAVRAAQQVVVRAVPTSPQAAAAAC
jgi:hypothetical protein